MNDATINRIRVVTGQSYWIDFGGKVESAKVIKVIDQHGAMMVKFRIGWPLVGYYTVESLVSFWSRMCKA